MAPTGLGLIESAILNNISNDSEQLYLRDPTKYVAPQSRLRTEKDAVSETLCPFRKARLQKHSRTQLYANPVVAAIQADKVKIQGSSSCHNTTFMASAGMRLCE